jgi:hypothetical protein
MNNIYVFTIIAILMPTYLIALSRIKLPDYIINLFNNDIFKIVWLSLMLIMGFKKQPHIALIVALIYVITLHYINKQQIKENFEYLEYFNQIK